MASVEGVDVGRTYGALLFGASGAFGLSGIVVTQCLVYFKQYPEDSHKTKAMVLASWLLDMTHSAFVMLSIYDYFIKYFGDEGGIDIIPWPLAVSVVVTALQTLLVHCFFAVKIFRSSRRNWYITGPIVLLAIARLVSASMTTYNMIHLKRFSAFMIPFPKTMFTTGLSLTAAVDILITGWLCYYLVEIRTRISPGSTMMIKMVDTLTLYTLENGALTCLAAVASLVCWLTMPHNLIFMGLHFVISKLYANSLLASLNMRRQLWQIHGGLDPSSDEGPSNAKKRGVESAFRIQNTFQNKTSKSTFDHPPSPYNNNADSVPLPPRAESGVLHRRGHEARGGDGVIQFRPASSYYWNVIARTTKPNV
ncbi:hypothetical protein DFP72DRAFT_544012 [Ephemerocybe angulata]|uniref:DUF6534 domain-containing protein n=1 Tax=Ephemerocybe angulata TaxID=980116 RepID=A0A8H6HMW8_9AGAR|nr:hypothetical protein DFP72DRAFT_544012 [Tulosesus angulatus]